MENQLTALISVIVPAYNVENYLERCIKSLLNQIYSNIEILIIDDGSTDHTDRIRKKLAAKDKRIKCLSYAKKEHYGLSAARNLGIENAAGEYIAFVDADDFVRPQFLEVLYRNLVQYQADISVCGYRKLQEKKAAIYRNGKKEQFPLSECFKVEQDRRYGRLQALFGKKTRQTEQHHDSKKIEQYTGKQMLDDWYHKHFETETVVWNKLYRKELFNDAPLLRFEEGILFEDVEFSLYAVRKAKKIVLCSEKLYFYMQRKGSIKGSRLTVKKMTDSLKVQRKRIHFLQQNQYLAAAKRCATDYEKYTIRYYFLAKETGQKKKVRAYVTKCFREMYAFAISGKEISKRDRLVLVCFKHFYRIF